MTTCHLPGCPRAATHTNGGCWEHADGTDLRAGAECEHGQLARKCDRCEDAREIARLTKLLEATRNQNGLRGHGIRVADVEIERLRDENARLAAALKTANDERDALRASIARLRSLANINPDVPLVEALRTLGDDQ